MFESIQQFVETVDPMWQWLAVITVSAVPYIESYGGAALGILSGVPAPVAIVAAIVGNWLSMVAAVTFGQRIYQWRAVDETAPTERKQRLRRAFEKYGVAGVSLMGQTILPSQLTSMAMVTFGVQKGIVIFWQTISIVLWGIALGVLTMFSVNMVVGAT